MQCVLQRYKHAVISHKYYKDIQHAYKDPIGAWNILVLIVLNPTTVVKSVRISQKKKAYC